MRRREAEQEKRASPPAWVTSTLAGLTRAGGRFNLAGLEQLRADRAQWCRENGCYRPRQCLKPCAGPDVPREEGKGDAA